MAKEAEITEIYDFLHNEYGPQGWWPVSGIESRYHPGDFSIPYNEEQRFEICIGAILTQNTSWNQVEKAIENLRVEINFTPEAVYNLDTKKLADLIRPAGYFNQKTKKLKNMAELMKNRKEPPSREELLNTWGIGPETADSILLYAFSEPFFVIDAYTRRIFEKLGIAYPSMSYEELRSKFEKNTPRDVKVYQEYHALIVKHAKKYYSKKPWGQDCPLARRFNQMKAG